jgi:hypothetical protein
LMLFGKYSEETDDWKNLLKNELNR